MNIIRQNEAVVWIENSSKLDISGVCLLANTGLKTTQQLFYKLNEYLLTVRPEKSLPELLTRWYLVASPTAA